MMTDKEFEVLKIKNSEEYKEYTEALCELASQYVPRIRAQYARKAFEMYQNETVRRVVLAYGEEAKSLKESRLRDFRFIADNPDWETAETALMDTCLSNASAYGKTISLLFDIT